MQEGQSQGLGFDGDIVPTTPLVNYPNMAPKKSQRKIVVLRAPIQKIKPEQVHKSQKDYSRTQTKKELREILKEVKKPTTQ